MTSLFSTPLWAIAIAICFLIVILVQLYYYTTIFSKLAFYKPKVKHNNITHPVTIIVCVKDEAENLYKNLPGVLSQDYSTTHSVLVVNDNSEDETKYILEALKKTFRQLNILTLTQSSNNIKGKKFPLSMGIMEAKTELLLLTDADCIPATEYWLEKMQSAFDEHIDIVLGYSPYKKQKGIVNKLIRFETFHTALQYLSFSLAGYPYMGVGRNLAYKKSTFINNKGFSNINHILSGDDDLFICKVATPSNTAIMIDKKAHVLTSPKTTWKEWRKQKERHYTTGKFYPKKIKLLLGLYALSQFLVYPLFICTALFFNIWIALILFSLRLIPLAYIWRKTMHMLNEKDLWKAFLLLDIWQSIYYFIFANAVFKRPSKTW